MGSVSNLQFTLFYRMIFSCNCEIVIECRYVPEKISYQSDDLGQKICLMGERDHFVGISNYSIDLMRICT